MRGAWSRRGAAIAGLAALLATLAGSTPAALEPVRLLSVTAQGPAVIIEATDPVAYTVSRPDAVTLVVDLRNAVIADAISRVEPRGPVAALRLEQTKAADGLGVARVRIALSRAVEYRVKSSRNSIRVELAAAAAAPAVAGNRCAGRATGGGEDTFRQLRSRQWPHHGSRRLPPRRLPSGRLRVWRRRFPWSRNRCPRLQPSPPRSSACARRARAHRRW